MVTAITAHTGGSLSRSSTCLPCCLQHNTTQSDTGDFWKWIVCCHLKGSRAPYGRIKLLTIAITWRNSIVRHVHQLQINWFLTAAVMLQQPSFPFFLISIELACKQPQSVKAVLLDPQKALNDLFRAQLSAVRVPRIQRSQKSATECKNR